MNLKRVEVVIEGHVQGIFFRSNTVTHAKKLGITGFVKNLPNETVKAVFEGNEKELNEILEFCKKGPMGARVTAVKVDWKPATNEFKDFCTEY